MYLDMWPVNLTEITKEHVRKKCPGMVIRYVPAGGTGLFQVITYHLYAFCSFECTSHLQHCIALFLKVGDTDLHFPYKIAIKKAFYLWYSASVTALSTRKESLEISMDEYKQAIDNLLSMAVLRDRAPVWAAEGIKAITKPRQRDEEGEETGDKYITDTINIVLNHLPLSENNM